MDNAYDALDRESFLAFVTDDVTYDSNYFGNTIGKEEMGKWFDGFTGTFNGKRHLLTNFLIAGEGNNATMLSYLIVFERIVDTEMVGNGMY